MRNQLDRAIGSGKTIVELFFQLGMQTFGFFREGFLQGCIADFAFQELLQGAVGFFGVQDKGILALGFQGRVVAVKRPVAGLHRELFFFLGFAHAD